jgi:hypothetical protein
MAVTVCSSKRATTYAVPQYGEILWYGVASAVPSGFAIDTFCANVFIQGCAAGAATNTQAGANSHTHTNPSTTGSQAAHTHPIADGGVGAAAGSATVGSSTNTYSAPASHSHNLVSGTSGSGGGHSHTLSAAALADAYPPYAQLYWIRATSESSLPIGAILMWDNPIASAPTGCVICNGSGGTIDLRDKFVYGAAGDTELGDTGGATTHVHTNADSGAAGTHTHTASLNSDGADSDKNISGFAGTDVSAGNHTHSVAVTTDGDADHSHTLSNSGSGSSLPPYVKLYFVQRTS